MHTVLSGIVPVASQPLYVTSNSGGGWLLSCRNSMSLPGLATNWVQPLTVWSVGAFSVGSHTGLSQLKRKTHASGEDGGLPRQWLAVRR